eukprot:CAMPEP_0183357412 /NCGR_PEP_ID=MMETSP0164_2-20130417/46194_1 /TAXON_ID=221442 /ORGANISM="Coccolithus pelagicus ssp braarudi, Strain PLY182g" /LENGTH=44 /DNA_ID= /DNA_START= /DNA_END= /DNA_ORIENTATION=
MSGAPARQTCYEISHLTEPAAARRLVGPPAARARMRTREGGRRA